MATRGETIAAAARNCVGTPFRLQGRVPGRGLDCVGLVAHVGQSLCLTPYDETGYGLAGGKERLLRGLTEAGLVPINPAEAGVGDVLVFSIGRGHGHVGIRSEHGLIHAHMGVGRVVEHRLDEQWRAALAAAFRFPPAATDLNGGP